MNDMALNVRVPDEIAAGVAEVAETEQRSRSNAVRVLLAEALRSRIARAERGREVAG